MRGASLSNSGPRRLVLHQRAAAGREPRQDRQGEHDDAHAAEPLGQAAPEEDRAAVARDVRHDARAGRREPAHGLEVGVDRPVDVAALDDVRQRAERGRRRARPATTTRNASRRPISRPAARQPLHAEADARRRSGAGTRNGASDSPYQSATPAGASSVRLTATSSSARRGSPRRGRRRGSVAAAAAPASRLTACARAPRRAWCRRR